VAPTRRWATVGEHLPGGLGAGVTPLAYHGVWNHRSGITGLPDVTASGLWEREWHVQQQLIEEAAPARVLADPHRAATSVPLGRLGQLRALHRQLVMCEHSVRVAQREAMSAMTDPDLPDGGRWAAVRRLRQLSWKVTREILPLVDRVPAGMHAEPAFVECRRAAHALRRTAESALRDHANLTVDLVAAAQVADHASALRADRTSVR
jgi:hypothetical protein